jgi:aromatic ring-opening dioxygenase catalytic subunit (LigB family)
VTDSPERLPTFLISHGGGPWPWIKDLLPGDWTRLERSLQSIPDEIAATPRAVLVVSAHWESRVFTVQGQAKPQMYYDYGGFPEFTYHLQYPAPGSPEVATRALELLEGAGISAARDDRRGFDHGMFAPMYVAYPKADVPMLQLSLRSGLDPAGHLAAGRALAPLRDEGVLIIASGVPTFHDLRSFGPAARVPATEFDGWLTETIVRHAGAERTARLMHWEAAPSARRAHPREEHLIPVMVAVGAAEDEPGTLQYHEDNFMGWMPSSGYRLG